MRYQCCERYSLYVAPLIIGHDLTWAGFTAPAPNARLNKARVLLFQSQRGVSASG